VTGPARAVALVTAGLVLLGGIALHRWTGEGWGVIALGLLIGAATLFERRYRAARDGDLAAWQRTGEREIDVETGATLEVWYDPRTGARRYEPIS